MGTVRVWRRFRLFPGVILNITKTGFSFSIGPKGAQFTLGTSGGRFTFSVPGSGVYYTHQFWGGKRKRSSRAKLPKVDS